ncbi:MAG: tetratricopeptide repeat protein [Burkholderiaceae bacterium]
MIRTIRRTAIVVLTAALCANAALAQKKPDSADPPVNSALDGELFYQLVLGELNAIGGEPGVGFSLLLDAARKTGDARLFKRATDIALRSRSGESALQAARAWRTALPQSREANRYLLQILIGLNRLAETLDPLKRDLALAPVAERDAAINNMPVYYARSSDKKQAASIVEQVLAAYLDSPELGPPAWTTIGRMRADAKDLDGAFDAAMRGQALDEHADGPAILALSLFSAGSAQAEPLVLRYLAGDGRFEVRMDYAVALLGKQRYAESAMQLGILTRDKPDYAQAWLVKGTLEQQNREWDQAEASLLRFVELRTSDKAEQDPAESDQALTQAYLRLSEITEHKKDLAGAKSWLDRIDNPEQMVSVQLRRAALLARQGNLAQARALIQSLPARTPEDARMKISAEVQILRDNKQYQMAYDVLAQALAENPKDLDFQYDQAMIAEKLGRLDEMERLLRNTIAIKPDYHHAYNALGYSLADRNVRLPEARKLIVKALEFAPNDPFISDSLAWVEFRSGNNGKALSILQKAYKDKPDAEIAAHLGEVLWAMNRHEQAKTVWREGLSLNADNETLLQTLKRLRVTL